MSVHAHSRRVELAAPPDRAHIDDSDLVRYAQGGDQDAFGQLYARHAGDIRALIGVRVREPAIVEDLAGETWLAAWKSLSRFRVDNGQGFGGWLAGVAKYTVMNSERYSRRHRHLSLDYIRETPQGRRLLSLDPADPVAHVDDRAIARFNLDRIRAVLDSLPDPQRRALLHQVADGLSDPEVAALMGRTPRDVNRLRGRARSYLRQLLPDISQGRPRPGAFRRTAGSVPLKDRPDYLAIRDRVVAGELSKKAAARELSVPRSTFRMTLARDIAQLEAVQSAPAPARTAVDEAER